MDTWNTRDINNIWSELGKNKKNTQKGSTF
jgi:hypothetical protein